MDHTQELQIASSYIRVRELRTSAAKGGSAKTGSGQGTEPVVLNICRRYSIVIRNRASPSWQKNQSADILLQS
jgi:hypothetical protein